MLVAKWRNLQAKKDGLGDSRLANGILLVVVCEYEDLIGEPLTSVILTIITVVLQYHNSSILD